MKTTKTPRHEKQAELAFPFVSSCLRGLFLLLFLTGFAFPAEPKPKVAVFPIAGDAPEKTRERVGFSMRAKLDREGTYEPIDGARMIDITSAAAAPVNFTTPLKTVQELLKGSDADVAVWGEMNGSTLKMNVFDFQQIDPLPHEVAKRIDEPTDVRFVIEEVLQSLAGVKKFEHPNEEAVSSDAKSQQLWESNPNLVKDGDFSKQEGWTTLYQAEMYPPPLADALPDVDRVNVYRFKGDDGQPNNALVMNLSRGCAENNGMACLSDPIPIEQATRYRLSFRYKSDGPKLHVFVKGYTQAPDINGKMVAREIYRRQVPPTGNTHGQWQTVVDDLNPQHVVGKVTSLRIDLYAYLHPGMVVFDDVVLKAVGEQTRHASDDAIKKPLTAPKSRQ